MDEEKISRVTIFIFDLDIMLQNSVTEEQELNIISSI
jgi:hypothetical protein